MTTYTTVDKSDWGAGPWQDEPDKVVWVDPATDLDAMVVRNRYGAWCGYVGVPVSHPLHGHRYADADVDIDLSYAALCRDDEPPETSICHVTVDRPANVWWFGFHCHNFMEFAPGEASLHRREGVGWPDYPCFRWREDGGDLEYRTLDYVRAEVTRLAAQLAAITERPSP